MNEGKTTPAGTSTRTPWKLGLLFAAGLFANEMACNVAALLDRFGGAKVTSSLAGELDRSALHMLVALLEMLAVHAVLLVIVGVAWAAVSRACLPAWTALCGGSRAARLAFWSLNVLVFVNAWYSLHALIVPGSRLAESVLPSLAGALEPGPFSVARIAAPALAVLFAAAAIGVALWRERALRRGALVGSALLLLAGLAYDWWTAPGPVAPFEHDGNIVMLGVDSLQVNRIGAHDGAPDPAPHTSAFLADAFRFENAWTPLARTYPSWLAMLTGREPVHHGVRFNLAPDADLSRSNQYLPAVLLAHGYSTLHATDETRFSIIRPMFGFEHLVHPIMGAQDFLLGNFFDFSAANIVRQTALGHDLFPAIAFNRASPAYNPRQFVRATIKAIDALPRDRPAFIVVHLCGDHWPFTVTAPWALRSDDPVACCIGMADDQVGALLDHLQAVGLTGRSTIALLSDHGDGWSGDPHDTTNSHGDDFRSLYGSRIVLGLQGPGVPRGSCATQVRSFDLYPTLIERAGLSAATCAADGAPDAIDAIDGQSLLPALSGQPLAARPLFAETDLDRAVYTVKMLVENHARWYEVDKQSGLVHMRPEGRDEFMHFKHYLMLADGLRLEVTPYVRQFRLDGYDTAAMRSTGAPPGCDAARRTALLGAMASHFHIDPHEWIDLAASVGFFAPSVASSR